MESLNIRDNVKAGIHTASAVHVNRTAGRMQIQWFAYVRAFLRVSRLRREATDGDAAEAPPLLAVVSARHRINHVLIQGATFLPDVIARTHTYRHSRARRRYTLASPARALSEKQALGNKNREGVPTTLSPTVAVAQKWRNGNAHPHTQIAHA